MNRKEIELQINQAIDDRFLFGDRPLKLVAEHILLDSNGEIGQQDLLPSYVLSLLSSKLVLEAYPSAYLADLARGLLLFHIRCFDLVYSKKSVSAVFKAVHEGDSGLVRRLYNQFDEYCRNTSLESIPEPSLAKWMMQQVGSVDARTAERHYKKGLERFYTQLIRVAPEFGKDASASLIAPPSETQSYARGSEFDLLHLLKRAMLDQYSFAPPIFGYQIPIAECLYLPITCQAKQVDLEEILGVLKGKSGLITGAPGSGRSTLMRQIAYLDACCKDSGQAIYYLSARYVLDGENVGDPLTAIARAVAPGSSTKDVNVIRAEVQRLDHEGLLIVLIDDLEHLLQREQKQVVERASQLSSAYLAVTPERVVSINAWIEEDSKPWIRLQMTELDGSIRAAFVQKVSAFLGRDTHAAAECVLKLAMEGMDLIQTPLGLCAVLDSLAVPLHIQNLFIAYECLYELLLRRGDTLELAEKVNHLNAVSQAVYTLGATIHDFWRDEPTWDAFSFEDRPFALISTQKIQEALLRHSGEMSTTLSMTDFWHLPILEHDENATHVRLRHREFETLLAAIYLSFHPTEGQNVALPGFQPLGRLRAGWCGEALSYANRNSEWIGELQKYLPAACKPGSCQKPLSEALKRV